MIAQVILPLSLAFIMFSMGLALVVDDFKKVSRFPKAFIIGLLLQIIMLPALAIGLGYFWQLFQTPDPTILAGLVILAACPGGVTSNMMTHLAKGDTALSISLTAVTSLLSLLTLPFVVNLGLDLFLERELNVALPIGKTVLGIFLITTFPVAIGMLIHHKKKDWAIKFEPKAKLIASILFALTVLGAIAQNWTLLMESYQTVAPMALSLNLITMVLAYLAAKALGLVERQGRAILFECGFQNGTLAITVALTFLGEEALMIPGAIYSLIMFVTGGIYLAILAKKPI